MHMRNKRKRELYGILLFLLMVGITLGFALLNATLKINGSSQIKNSTWDIHFANVVVNDESVEIGTGDSAATITPNNNQEVTYTITLSKPGDFYEFTVDAVNSGSIDGMIDVVTSKLNNVVIDQEHPLPVYLDYYVTYSDDEKLAPNHILKAGKSDTYKVRVEFKSDIENDQLPSDDITLCFSFSVTYVQADDNAIDRNGAMFIDGKSFNVRIKELAGITDPVYDYYYDDSKITSIRKSATAPNMSSMTDDNMVAVSSDNPIYAWYDNGTIYYYTEAEIIYMNSSSNHMFSYMQ